MKKIFSIIAFLSCFFYVYAQPPAPSGLPAPYSTGYYRIGWIQSDSGFIYAPRDTTIRSRYPGLVLFWGHAGVDSSAWMWNGRKYVKELNSQDTLPGRFLVTPSFLFNQGFLKVATDSLWRTPGKDSLQFTIGGRYHSLASAATSGSVFNQDSIKHRFVDTGGTARNLYTLAWDSLNKKWILTAPGSGGGGSGTVTLLSFTAANGFTGSFSNPSTTPNLTIGTSVTGLLFGNGTAISNATVSTPLTYSTGALGIQIASGSQAGAVSSTDWTTFNGKINLTSLSATSPLLYNNTTGVFSIQVANTSQNGYLSSTDWNTFNGKQGALSGTGYLNFSGTTPSYLTPTQVTADLNLFSSTLQGLVPSSGGGTVKFLRSDGLWTTPPGGGSDSGIIAGFGIKVNRGGPNNRVVNADTSGTGLSLYYLRKLDSTLGYTTPKKLNDSLLARVIHVTTSTIRLRNPDFNTEQIYLDDASRNGFFQYDALDAISVDDSSMVFVTTGGARYKRVVIDNFLNVKWFGAVGTGSDDIYSIQKAVNYVINNSSSVRAVYFPSGTYNISGPILLAKLVSGQFSQVTVNLIGPTRAKNSSAGYAIIHTTFNNTFAVCIQKGKGCLIKDLAFDGIFDFPNSLTPIQIDTLKFAQWTDGSSRDNRYSPYSGIAIDPFSDSTVYLSNSDMYPGLHSYYPAGLSRSGSTDILLDNVQIQNFIVGMMITPSNQQNGEEINMIDCNIGGNKVGWSASQAQSKDCHVDRFQCWIPEHTIFDNVSYGFFHGNGGGAVYVHGGNIANGVYQLGNIQAVDFISTFEDIYSEGLFKLGFMGGNKGCSFLNCDFDFSTQDIGIPYPDMFILGGNSNFVNCKLNLLSGTVPRIILSGASNSYRGGDMPSPPYVDNINNNSNTSSFSTSYPSFLNVNMIYPGGVLGDNKTPSFFNHLSGLDPNNLSPIYPGNTYQYTTYQDGGGDVLYQLKYNGSYDRTIQLGINSIVTNKTSWTAFFKLASAVDTNILKINDMLLTSSVPYWDQNSASTAGSYPIGFISSIGHDTVYVKSLAIGIKDSAYTVYAAYWQRPKAALTGDIVNSTSYISKAQASSLSTLSSAFSVGDRLDIPQCRIGTKIISISNDTIYLSQPNQTGTSYTDYTFMNGYPEVSMFSPLNPQQLLVSGFSRNFFGGAKYYKWKSTIPLIGTNSYTSLKMGNMWDESYLIQNSNFNSDTSKHKFKFYSLNSKSNGQSVSVGSTANRFSGNYASVGLFQINTDSTDNGFSHLTVWDGTAYRQVAYKADLTVLTSTNTSIGSGFPVAVTNTNNVKSLFGSSTVLIDSTTNLLSLTLQVDTSSGNQKISTQGFVLRNAGVGTLQQILNKQFSGKAILTQSDTIQQEGFAYIHDSAASEKHLNTNSGVKTGIDYQITAGFYTGAGINQGSGGYRINNFQSYKFGSGFSFDDAGNFTSGLGTFNALTGSPININFSINGTNLRKAALTWGGTNPDFGAIGVNSSNLLGNDGTNNGFAMLFDSRLGSPSARIFTNSVGTSTLSTTWFPNGNMKLFGAGAIGEDSAAALQLPAGATTKASLYIPEGVAPTSPKSGHIWAQTSDHNLYIRLNGVSVCLSCGVGGISRISPIDSLAKSANGIQISGVNLVPQSADASFPGFVTTGTQTFAGLKILPAPIFTGLTSSGANDSVLTVDPSTGQVHRRAGIFALNFANGLTAATVDSVYWGGTLNQPTSILGAGFAVAFGTSGSNLGGLSITGGKYNSTQGSQLLGAASTINNAITSASGNVTNFSGYAFLAPTLTSTNTGVTYASPATLYIDGPPVASTNSTITGINYSLNVNSGIVHFGGSGGISGIFDGSLSVKGGTVSNAYNLSIGASTTANHAVHFDTGVDPTTTVQGGMWWNGTNLYFGDAATNKRDLLNGIHNYVHTIFTPTTGGTVSLVANNYNIINPAGSIAALTLTLPPSPVNNDLIYIKFTQPVLTTLAFSGGTVGETLPLPVAGSLIVLTYDGVSATWY